MSSSAPSGGTRWRTLAPPPMLDTDRVALFLDLDGTIAEIAERPEKVGPQAGRTRLLRALDRALRGRLAVLTGRTLEGVDRILEEAVTAVAGVHGLVLRLPDASVRRFDPSPKLGEAKRALQALARIEPGLIVEDKGVAVALHYRRAPFAERLARETTARIAADTGLVVQQGSMVSELRTAGPDKGDCLRTFLREPPFAGFAPVMVGDDLTDEPAFEAARDLGGHGVLVGPPRATAALFRLTSVGEALAWLDREPGA